MDTQTLRSFFESDLHQRRALDAVARDGWLDPSGNPGLYEASKCAFDPSSNANEASRSFETIKQFRNSHPTVLLTW